MKCSLDSFRRTLISSLFVLAGAGLDAGAMTAGANAQAKPAVVQADGQKQNATDAGQQQQVFSGPQPGEEIRPFKVVKVTDDETQELEVVNDNAERTTLICFIHELGNDDRILFGLPLVDFYASRHEDLNSHFVLLSDDREKITTMLRGWARGPLFAKSLVSMSVDGVEGPGYYGLNRNVTMTVLVAKGNKVVTNLVFQAPNNRDLEKIMAAVAKALDEEAPTLAEVQQELRAERQRRNDERIKASPVFQLAPNEELGRIMFGMVNARGNRSQIATRRSQELIDWAGDSKERRLVLKEYCKAVLAGDFGLDRYSLEAIKQLAAD